MSTSIASQDQATIHALNIHGIFFERRCATAVGDTPGWKTLATNYPVEFPPPNGPWRGKESSLDIWARKNTDSSFVIDALIECKKANPEFINWVFFPKHDLTQQTAFRFANVTTASNSDGSGQWSIQTQLQTGTTTIGIASDAREVRGDYILSIKLGTRPRLLMRPFKMLLTRLRWHVEQLPMRNPCFCNKRRTRLSIHRRLGHRKSIFQSSLLQLTYFASISRQIAPT